MSFIVADRKAELGLALGTSVCKGVERSTMCVFGGKSNLRRVLEFFTLSDFGWDAFYICFQLWTFDAVDCVASMSKFP